MNRLDPDTRARLERLREHDATGVYSSDEPSEGTDPGQTLTVTIDPTHRVSGVQIHNLDPLRSPAALSGAFDAAYAEALAARRTDPAPAARPEGQLPVARPLQLSVMPVTPDMLNRHSIRTETKFNPSRAGHGYREEVGISNNTCVSATVRPASPVGPIEVDAGWLQNARASNVANAIVEAFTDAYSKRDN